MPATLAPSTFESDTSVDPEPDPVPTPSPRVLIIGSGHLAARIRSLAANAALTSTHLSRDDTRSVDADESRGDALARILRDIDFATIDGVFLVDDRDDVNLELLIALASMHGDKILVASLFNESIAPHLQAAHPNIRVLNPARIAAPHFVRALDAHVTRTLRYVPAEHRAPRVAKRGDALISQLCAGFAGLIAAATAYFHVAERLSWLDAIYFVVVTVATVGYGDITLLHSGVVSKLVGIGLILCSTAFIWMIFSLTVDGIIKRRVQLALGRKVYAKRGHVILCGLGRLGHCIGEELLERGEHLLIIEQSADAPSVEYFRSRGADVYIGNARLPQILKDVGASDAKALYAVISDDLVNLEIGLNARVFQPGLRLVLRLFDQSMAARIDESLDIHLSYSMSAIADEAFMSAFMSRT